MTNGEVIFETRSDKWKIIAIIITHRRAHLVNVTIDAIVLSDSSDL